MGSAIKGNDEKESFYKWFLEIEEILFQDFPHSSEEDEDEECEEGEIPLSQKRRIERVKKCIKEITENSDILLEIAEDKRSDSSFVSEFSPLEAFAVLGAVSFFHKYAKQDSQAEEAFKNVKDFLQNYKSAKYAKEENVLGMQNGLDGLESYIKTQKIQEVKKCNQRVLQRIKLHFLMAFPQPFLQNLLQIASTNAGDCSLNKYHTLRSLRLGKCGEEEKTRYSDLSHEKQEIVKLLASYEQNPKHLLAICQFLTDYLSSIGQEELDFKELKFDKDSEVVEFIRNSSEKITEKYPSFLRANFLFAEIFASQLSITRQDREYSESLLLKTLNANPTSSKINHKLGLFLIKSRQFTEARTYIQKSIKLNPTNSEAYNNLAKLLLRDTIANKEILESFFNSEFSDMMEILGPENELSFWKGCYFFKTGDKDLAVDLWVETILEFYVRKPELDLETVLPFKKLRTSAKVFLWFKSTLTLESVQEKVEDAISQEKTKRRVVFHRLKDLVLDAML